MAHRKPILEDGWALIADDDEITVGQRKRLGDAITDSIAATYRLNALANVKKVELEKALSQEEKQAEKGISPEARNELRLWRSQVAELVALREMPPEDQEAIGRHQRVRILCYLRDWWKDEPIPVSDEDFDNLSGSLFDALFMACGDALPEVPSVAETPDNQADPKAPIAV